MATDTPHIVPNPYAMSGPEPDTTYDTAFGQRMSLEPSGLAPRMMNMRANLPSWAARRPHHARLAPPVAADSLGAEPALGTLSSLLDLLTRGGSGEQLAKAVAPLVAEALRSDTAAVFAVRPDGGAALVSVFGPTRKRTYPYPPLSVADPLLTPLQSVRLVSQEAPPRRTLPAGLSSVLPTRVGRLVVAGGRAQHALTALIVLGWRESRILSPQESQLLLAIADATGLALGCASEAHQTHQSEVVLDTACAVARAISGSLDLEETFKQIAASTAAVMGDCRCLLTELDEATGELVAVATSDPEDNVLLGMHVQVDNERRRPGSVDELRTIVVEDIVFGARTGPDVRARLALSSALFVPITSEDALIGSLFLYSTARRSEYSARDIARAEALAEQAASAICNARLFQDLENSRREADKLLKRVIQLRAQRRLELANAVHDDIVQTVVAALYEVEGLGGRLTAQADDDLTRVADLLRRAITEARRLIWHLRPPVLDGLGLAGAITGLVERVSTQSSARFSLQVEDDCDAGAEASTAVYMVAREALQNAVRHSRGSSVRVCLEKQGSEPGDRSLVLTVADDGIGFDLRAVQVEDHFGLTMMDEQAMLAGGALSIDSSPGRGCCVTLITPLRPEATDDHG